MATQHALTDDSKVVKETDLGIIVCSVASSVLANKYVHQSVYSATHIVMLALSSGCVQGGAQAK